MNEIELILAKLKIVSEEKENGCYLCDKEHSKLLLDYINNLEKENEKLRMRNDMLICDIDSFIRDNKIDYKGKVESIKFYIEQSDIKDMMWGKEILEIIGDEK